jgi:exopolysaccharide biosynthesis polyprenyl glycosylphosphotransferase
MTSRADTPVLERALPRRAGEREWRTPAIARRLAVAVTDATLATLALVLAARGTGDPDVTLAYAFPLLVVALTARSEQFGASLLDGLGRALAATTVVAMALIALDAVLDARLDELHTITRLWLFATAWMLAARVGVDLALHGLRAAGIARSRTLIVGAGRVGTEVGRWLRERPELGLELAGYVDDVDPEREGVEELLRGGPVLGGVDELPALIAANSIDHVVVTFTARRGADEQLAAVVRDCERVGADVSIVPRLFESLNGRAEVDRLGAVPLMRLRPVHPRSWPFAVKHGLDRVLALLMLIVATPVLALGALAVKLSSPGPIVFRQRRVGRDGHAFELLKLRTMRGSPESDGQANESWACVVATGGREAGPPPPIDDARVTPVGRFLRRACIDELPQLLNVLRGDMSLVGPRPEVPEYVALFEDSIRRYGDRHRVKSGLTGWAQVHGLRGETSLADRVAWDNYYIENWSLALDLRILLLTPLKILTGGR